MFMGFYFQRLEICPAGKIITLIGLPIGIISGTFNIIPILTYIPGTAPGYTGMSVAGTATGAMLTVLAHPWLSQSSSKQGKLGVSRLAVILVCIGALMLFMLFSELLSESRHDFIKILTYWEEALFVLSIISLLILLSPKGQRDYVHSVSVGCVISMGLGVAFATAYYFGRFRELGGESDLDRLGIPIAVAVIISIYSCFLFLVVIIFGLTQGRLNAGRFGTMNWHMTEIYVFFVFLMLAPPSIWEAIGKSNFDDSAVSNEALASRIQSLEEKLEELDIPIDVGQ
ncbi:MAG: hypothetical protein HN432_05405 [Gammaproteobacteria bacterium]|nr:hypothetical protein [Gammaproteobacteria bacterium]